MELSNQAFNIQGVSVNEICEKFGTPLYVYDSEIIEKKVNDFRSAFAGTDLKIKFAIKSCTNISIAKLMKNLGTGIDTVSIPEIQMGLKAGFQPNEIVFTPNIVDFEEIKKAVEFGTYINIENLQNLEKFGKEYGNSVPCCLRLNPNIISEVERGEVSGIDFANINKEHYSAVNSKRVSVWHNQSKFGISLSQFSQLLEIVKKYNIKINGLHIHSSHVILSPEVFLKGAKIIFEISKHFNDLEYLDFGGGIMVPHKADDEVIDIDEIGSKFVFEFKEFCKQVGKNLELWFEPGRYLMSESGYLFTKAVVLKTNGYIDFVGTNTGFNHLLRPMMYDAYHEIVNISNPNGEKKKYNVVGNLCEIDNIGKDRFLSEVRENDILAIKNAGAYGFSMSSNYNSRFKPAEVLIINGEAKMIRKRDTYEDLLRNQVEINIS